MSRKGIFLLFFTLIVLVSSCYKLWDYDIQSSVQPITVNSILVAGQPVYVGVYESIGLDSITGDFDYRYYAKKDAEVHISDDQGKSWLLFYRDSIISDTIISPNGDVYYNAILSCYYNDSLKAIAGHTYYLTVEVDGYQTICARTTVPDKNPDIDSFSYFIDSSLNEATAYFRINDKCGRDYYWIVPAEGFNVNTEEPVNLTHSGKLSGTLISDSLFDCSSYVYSIKGSASWLDDLGSTAIYIVNNDFFRYVYSADRQLILGDITVSYDSPFSEPVPVYSNIENGAGIFAAVGQPVYLSEIKKQKK